LRQQIEEGIRGGGERKEDRIEGERMEENWIRRGRRTEWRDNA
jgi:hypothetical protein